MAKRSNFQLSTAERRMRRFSENFKREKVREIESGRTRVSEICKQYEVSSVNVNRWINKFGSMKKKKERVIVETDSDTKQLLELKKKIAELERIVGQKQILLDFKDKMIDLAEETYGVDIKKKFTTKPSSTTGTIGKDTPSA
jgi:transposase